jgi:hypothetical protein
VNTNFFTGNNKKVQSTPLLEYVTARKPDKRGRDEKRRRENDKRKMRIERKTKEVSIKVTFMVKYTQVNIIIITVILVYVTFNRKI